MKPRRRHALLLLLGALSACGGGRGLRPVMGEYRAVAPVRQPVQPAWLAAFTTDELFGRLSADGRRLVYAGNQKGNLDIWIKDLTTGVPERIAAHEAEETQPAWDPAGERIVFVSMRVDAKGDLYLWDDGALTRLTDQRSEDAYPTFAPDGDSVYFASGPEGLSRIERLDLDSKRRTPITDWRATHPAVSPDGRYLAYTLFDDDERGRIAVVALDDPKRVHLITTAAYHAGFPAFSADGRTLYFSRFTAASPLKPLEPGAVASLWQVELGRALAAKELDEELLQPLTSGRIAVLFAQHVAGAGIVFTSARAGNLDIGLLPEGGPFPRLATAEAQLELARQQVDPHDRLLGLHLVYQPAAGRQRRGAAASRARYLAATVHRELGEFDWARRLLGRLIEESPLRHGNVAYLAAIDATLLEVEQRLGGAKRGNRRLDPTLLGRARQALAALQLPTQPDPEVSAHLLLRQGDLQRLAGEDQAAIRSYEELIRRFPGQQAHAVEAKFHLGGLFAAVKEPRLLAAYYLTLFSQYPRQLDWLRRTADAVLELFGAQEPAAEVEALRALMDANRDKPLLWARAQLRLGRLFEGQDRLDLAIEAMDQVIGTIKQPELAQERTAAAFELGRLSLANYDVLRREGRLSEALRFYDKALQAYAGVVKAYQPGHEHHIRARVEYLRLSLLMAAQLERDGERALAEKRHRAILAIDPDMLQAHRKLIQFGVARGEAAALRRTYEARLSKDASDPVGHYALGYLATFTTPVTAATLDAAEAHLRRAIDLNPRSPFGHMTLGWVYEMRERLLAQVARGHLEEALLLYDRAYKLNDAKVDVQTEADLLINQCNAFANLGNGWKQAYDFCSKRDALKIPFASRRRAAHFHLTYGRAATAMDRQELAEKELERAVDLAQDLGDPDLQAEATARLALAAQLRGDLDGSTRQFQRAMELFKARGRTIKLASLQRSVAYNHSLAGRHAQVLEQVQRAEQALRLHGTSPVEKYKPNGPAGRSTNAYSLEPTDEAYLALALQDHVYRRLKSWREVAPRMKQRIGNREQAEALREKEDRADDELGHELIQLRNNSALVQLRLGHEASSLAELDRGLAALEQRQTEEKLGFVPSAELFPLQVALTLNRAEVLLARLAGGRPLPDAALTAALQQVQRLERLRAAHLAKEKKRLLSPRLRLQLWSDLALLSFHAGLRGLRGLPAEAQAPARIAGGQPINPNTPAARGLVRLQERGALLAGAVRLLRQVLAEIDPKRLQELEEGDEVAQRDDALKRGTLAPLWMPLMPAERLRWYMQAGINLVEVAAALTPRERLASHGGAELLKELTATALQHEVGALRFVAAAALADHNDDPAAMAAAVQGYLARSPLLLDRADLRQAGRIRGQIFGRAVALSLRRGELKAALAYAEQRERRGFVDELVQHGPRGRGRAAAPLAALLERSRRYRRHLTRQDPAGSEEQLKAWQAEANTLERAVVQGQQALRAAAPRVADLLEVGAFPHDALLGALAPDDVVVTALTSAGKVQLVSLLPATPPRAVPVPQDLAALRRLARSDPAALARTLRPLLVQLCGPSRRAYVDLGRISAELNPAELLPGKSVVRLATLWELLDAHAVRNLAYQEALVVDPSVEVAGKLAKQLGGRALAGAKLTRAATDRSFERAGVLVLSDGLRFDGGEAVNARLLLHDPAGRRLDDLRLAWSLGQPLRGHLLAVTALRHTPDRERAERVALTRMAHAMGVPSLLIVEGEAARPAALGGIVKRIKGALQTTDLATAVARAAAGGARRLTLYGHGGMTPEQGKAFAAKMLGSSASAGAKAFAARRLAEAVEHLEATLRFMEYLQDFKYLDGALLFLGQTYTLLEDYERAIPVMKRLLALRQQAIDEARAAKKDPLGAQANWVKVVTDMAWLRLRNEQYDEALTANQQAIDLYLQVKRPLLARAAYDQRSLIAERKGDQALALRFAQKTLETARAELKAKPGSSAQAAVVEAAGRVARLQRMKFSNYRAAMTAARLGLEHIPAATPQQRKELDAQIAALRAKAKGLKGKELEALKKQFSALSARQSAVAGALKDRVELVLEIGRIQSARGDYNRAVARATEALELARSAGLPADTALLELVNNLYYLGAYGQALLHADEGLRLATDNPLRQIQFFNAKGTTFAALGRTDQALTEVKAALAIARKLDNPVEIAASENNLGNALRLAGRFELAQAAFRAALELDRKREDKLGMAFDYANLGLTEELMGRARDARRHLLTALSLSKEIGAPLNQLKALAGLGRLELAARKAQAAEDRFRAGLALAQRLGLRDWIWRFRLHSGRALRALGQPARAQAQLQLGLEIVEERPPRIRKASTAPEVEEEPEDLYDELVDLTATRGQAEQAFELSERLRARSLVDLVSQNAAQLPLEQAAKAMRAITALQLELEAARTARTRDVDDAEARAAADKEIARIGKELTGARAVLAALNPRLPALVTLDLEPLARLRPLLARHKDTLFISYVATRAHLVVFTLRGDAPLRMDVLGVGRKELTGRVERFRRALTSFHQVQDQARALYALLLAPALKRAGGAAPQRLVIIPSGPLHVLPFAALHDGRDYVIARHTISSLPSLNALRRLAPPAGPRPAGKRVAFGWAGGGAARPPLTFSGREAEALGQTFSDALVVQGAEATKARFIKEAPGAALLHVATHASFLPDAPLRSALELADGELPVLEVLGLKLSRPLVLLSACETGRGVLAGADGVLGLQQAFLAAGAEQVVASLYRVSDLGSALLMKHLFRELRAGKAPAQALRQAQNTVRRRLVHPAFWAGFRLDGAL